MTTVKDIENAVTALKPSDFAEFRAWFDELTAAHFDDTIEKDLAGGRLDKLADEALADSREGRARSL